MGFNLSRSRRKAKRKLPIQRRTPASRRLLKVGAIAAGAALIQYFRDPDRGRARRAKAKEQAVSAVRQPAQTVADRASGLAEVARDKASGLTHEATRSPDEELPENDQVLVDKVRSEVLGGERWSGVTVNVSAADGVVTLHGELPHPDDIRELEQEVRKIPGVKDVEHHLHLPNTPAPNTEKARKASARGGGRSYG